MHGTVAPTDADVLLREIARLAREFGKTARLGDDIDDVAQDIAFACWRRMQSGVWNVNGSQLPAFVRGLVRQRVHDLKRSLRRSDIRELQHVYELHDREHVWMCPEESLDVDLTIQLGKEILAGLTPTRRLVFQMVRVHGMTYARVAQQLGITESTVGSHVTRAHREIRCRLEERGIHAPTRFESVAAARQRRERRVPAVRALAGVQDGQR